MNELFPDKGYVIDNANFIHSATIDLSIIIATYNAEDYIEECLNSVLKQKTKYNIEIIIVNDGSTDSTAERIKPYLSDKRVKYFEQKNAGQSAARNFAIFNSIGKYIMIVDSDDVISDNCIDCLMDAAIKNNCDIAEGKYNMFYDTPTFQCEQKTKIRKPKGKVILRSVGYSWAKVYKRELWENVYYPIGYIFEDIISKFILKRKANAIAFTDAIVYGYRVGVVSSSHSSNEGKFINSIRVLPKVWELCEKNKISKDKTFYLLSLNHIGLLNYVMLKSKDEHTKSLAFSVMVKQLNLIEDYKPMFYPFMFRLLRRSIINGKIKAWQTVASTILKYKLLKRYREKN
ncbi:MAG: glycosyltransferase family 2 protein [Clostridia bacterium]|nr:glycosyltransferase family 2 protein [Clostridia bacterium]